MVGFIKKFKNYTRRAFVLLINAVRGDHKATRVNVIAANASASEIEEVRRRAQFFFGLPAACVTVHRKVGINIILSPAPVLLFGLTLEEAPLALRMHPGVFDVDYRRNPMDGWFWCEAATYMQGLPDIKDSQRRLMARIELLKKLPHSHCYVFGTGPSLESAQEHDWSDGIRVVCNTIVRDASLWAHIQPHLIVAGDAIYHFGFTEFAKSFRRDLYERMKESDCLFIYPDYFHFLVSREFKEFEDRLIPVPNGVHHNVHEDLAKNFALPPLGNVLNKLLLPIGCNLRKTVYLWGFDGRAPKDKLFWSNSTKQSYTELLPTLQEAHPAFFDHFVPKDNPEKYVQSVHGDVLEFLLSQAETLGWRFGILHHTWTETLAKRRVQKNGNEFIRSEIDA